MERTLYRSTSKKLIAGVAGGIAEYFAIDPVLVRALFIALLFGSGVSVIIYLVLWLIVPKQPAIPVTQT
ncbi:MAG: PspC domain-containing protein, partial [Candidatus Kapabacteria bacterium]|nr:PspC domain-containing protein [Candidatus Kapabacteria bacterium]